MAALNEQYLCPVCGYGMQEPPENYNICPSCGTEFGIHDVNASILELRAVWLQNGCKWWSDSDPKPANWDPYGQLALVTKSAGAYVQGSPAFTISNGKNYENCDLKSVVTPWAGKAAWQSADTTLVTAIS